MQRRTPLKAALSAVALSALACAAQYAEESL